jgi:hypothetical protein
MSNWWSVISFVILLWLRIAIGPAEAPALSPRQPSLSASSPRKSSRSSASWRRLSAAPGS